MKYLALLRGINVGGNNIIKMAQLREVFEKHGFQNVQTYIQSGNVIFESIEKDTKKLTSEIEKLLTSAFSYDARIVLRSQSQLAKTLSSMPEDWQTRTDIRCYIAFVKEPYTAEEIAQEIQINTAVDFLKTGPQALYMSTLTSGLMKSGFTKMIGTKIYQHVTMRNLNTSLKLLEMMEKL